jgi:hypothetical protein
MLETVDCIQSKGMLSKESESQRMSLKEKEGGGKVENSAVFSI